MRCPCCGEVQCVQLEEKVGFEEPVGDLESERRGCCISSEKLQEVFNGMALYGSAFTSVSWSTGYVKPDPWVSFMKGWTVEDEVSFQEWCQR